MSSGRKTTDNLAQVKTKKIMKFSMRTYTVHVHAVAPKHFRVRLALLSLSRVSSPTASRCAVDQHDCTV